MARARSAAAPQGRACAAGLIERAAGPIDMIPLLLFLLAIAAVYVGTIETAFSALMRLSLRLMAERGGRDDRLGFYLEDPIQLFVPARLLLGIIFSLATMFIADPDRAGPASRRSACCSCSSRSSSSCASTCCRCSSCAAIPERVLEVLLPPSTSPRDSCTR